VKITRLLCLLLCILFLLTAFQIFLPGFRDIARGRLFFLVPALYSAAGLFLALRAFKSSVPGRLRILLLGAGISSAVFVPLAVLHNLFYALAIRFETIPFIKTAASASAVFSFIAALMISPLSFAVFISAAVFYIIKPVPSAGGIRIRSASDKRD
jgi:hypothetical protein